MLTLLALWRLAGWLGYPEYDEPSSSFGATLDNLFSSPRRVSVVSPKSYEDAQDMAECFKRQQIVLVNIQNVDGEISKRIVDFCAGLAYALGGRVRPIADQLFLLAPRDVELLDEEDEQLAKREFFNQL